MTSASRALGCREKIRRFCEAYTRSYISEITWVGSLILLYLVFTGLILQDLSGITKPPPERNDGARAVLGAMVKVFDQAEVYNWWISGPSLLALSATQGNAMFLVARETVIEVSMDATDVDKVLNYVENRFTSYDREKVQIHADPFNCLTPLNFTTTYFEAEDKPEVSVRVISYRQSLESQHPVYYETCWSSDFGYGFYRKRVRQGEHDTEYSVKVQRSWILPSETCQTLGFFLKCPPEREKLLKLRYGSQNPPSSVYRILARLLESDRRIYWAPILFVNLLSGIILCTVVAPSRRRTRRYLYRRRKAANRGKNSQDLEAMRMARLRPTSTSSASISARSTSTSHKSPETSESAGNSFGQWQLFGKDVRFKI
ncbi:hypothetical protein AAMO2058_001182800 [Amorphochlora amoebiformis]